MMRRSRREVVLVALVCLGPLALAVLAYFGPIDLRGAVTLENPDRELLAAAMPLPELALPTPAGGLIGPDWARYRWSLIYARMTPCESQCARHLASLTQVYLALGRDRGRAQRVVLTVDADFRMADDPTLLVGYVGDDRTTQLVDALGRDRLERGRIFVVDPLGNLVMSYPPDADQARLLRDLERLLDVSRIG